MACLARVFFPVLLSVLLCACGATGSGNNTGEVPVAQGPSMLVKGSAPVQLYSQLALKIRSCWLDPRDPVLTKHVFRAEAPAVPRGPGVTRIAIHEQTNDQKRGLKAFTIDLQPVRGGTQITSNNHKLPYALGQKLVSDVGYWAQGGQNCDGPAVAGASGPRGSSAGPR